MGRRDLLAWIESVSVGLITGGIAVQFYPDLAKWVVVVGAIGVMVSAGYGLRSDPGADHRSKREV